MKCQHTVALMFAALLVTPSLAQQGQATQPRSGLGESIGSAPLEVVYPAVESTVRGAVNDAAAAQLTPGDVAVLKRMALDRAEQMSSPYVTPPAPITRTVQINLDPGESPPVIRLAQKQFTSIVFSDYQGQPWFIDNVRLSRTAFSDGRGSDASAGQAPTNVLTIEPLQAKSYGNVAITLRGLATPVIFMLSAGQTEVDVRVDAKAPGRNPDSAIGVQLTAMPAIDNDLTAFLDGVPPEGARRLAVEGLRGVQAWRYRDQLYVRAHADAQYPAYISAARSTSGIAVYRYAGMHTALTFTTAGQAVTVFVDQHKRGQQ